MRASVRIVTFVPLVVLVGVVLLLAGPPWPAYRVIGLVLAILGFTALTAARLTLGNSFSITPQARQLVTSGIYSRVRHPVYVFSTIAIGGLFLYIRQPWFCLILIPLVILQVIRACAEERVLTEKFGEAYTRYKQQTWF
jgi:protein-S-isoprenylcysteine O-methyltransferase Ste14